VRARRSAGGLGVVLAAALVCATAGGGTGAARAEDAGPEACRVRDPLRLPFFGDTHVHTAFSQDAATQGTRNLPADAYRFARGEPIGIQPYDAAGEPGRTLRLARPLDFAIVTDHAEQLGEVHICSTPGLPGHDSWVCRMYRRFPRLAFFVMNTRISYFAEPSRFAFCGPDGALCREAARTPWREIRQAAEAFQDRSPACRFTTFVGYEWTGAAGSKNLHRNVIFRNDVVPAYPTSYVEAPTPEALWEALRRDCIDGPFGCDALTIPHNSNLSAGLMFRDVTSEGLPLDRAYARERAFFEPLVEVMQHKGSSECGLAAAAEDELCGFELLPYEAFQGKYVPWLADDVPESSYVRNALGRGLLHADRVGANPFKLGMVASSDTHLGAAGYVVEEDHPGHGGAGAPAGDGVPEGLPDDIEFNPGGLAVLWAEENTREALFAAMRRREAYGTSGTRPVLRFFGGWGLPEDLCEEPDFVARADAAGVPMGADLPPRPEDAEAPRFALLGLADPGTPARPGTPLQRLQIVKGWVEDGAVRERVHDVVGDAEGGAGVDRRTCARHGEGSALLCGVWRDPDFDPEQRAYYYVRLLENPSCRWSAWVCSRRGVRCDRPGSVPEGLEACCAPDHRWEIQERAWSSPIWYAPRPAEGDA